MMRLFFAIVRSIMHIFFVDSCLAGHGDAPRSYSRMLAYASLGERFLSDQQLRQEEDCTALLESIQWSVRACGYRAVLGRARPSQECAYLADPDFDDVSAADLECELALSEQRFVSQWIHYVCERSHYWSDLHIELALPQEERVQYCYRFSNGTGYPRDIWNFSREISHCPDYSLGPDNVYQLHRKRIVRSSFSMALSEVGVDWFLTHGSLLKFFRDGVDDRNVDVGVFADAVIEILPQIIESFRNHGFVHDDIDCSNNCGIDCDQFGILNREGDGILIPEQLVFRYAAPGFSPVSHSHTVVLKLFFAKPNSFFESYEHWPGYCEYMVTGRCRFVWPEFSIEKIGAWADDLPVYGPSSVPSYLTHQYGAWEIPVDFSNTDGGTTKRHHLHYRNLAFEPNSDLYDKLDRGVHSCSNLCIHKSEKALPPTGDFECAAVRGNSTASAAISMLD